MADIIIKFKPFWNMECIHMLLIKLRNLNLSSIKKTYINCKPLMYYLSALLFEKFNQY